jgi:hypothetical protein
MGKGRSCDLREPLGGGANLSHLSQPTPYLAAPLCHLMSSRAWWVVAATGEAAVSRNSCRGWALCWGWPKAQSSAASTSGGPLIACSISMLSQIRCTVSWRQKSQAGPRWAETSPRGTQSPDPHSHHCKPGSLGRVAAPMSQSWPG